MQSTLTVKYRVKKAQNGVEVLDSCVMVQVMVTNHVLSRMPRHVSVSSRMSCHAAIIESPMQLINGLPIVEGSSSR